MYDPQPVSGASHPGFGVTGAWRLDRGIRVQRVKRPEGSKRILRYSIEIYAPLISLILRCMRKLSLHQMDEQPCRLFALARNITVVWDTRAGLTAAAARGRKGGRKPVVTPEKLARAKALMAGGLNVREAAARVKVGKTALYAALKSVSDLM